MTTQTTEAMDILREFVADVMQVGNNDFEEACTYLEESQDWYDLAVTFKKAYALIERENQTPSL